MEGKMTPEAHIQVAIEHLEIARADLLIKEFPPDGYGGKSRTLRLTESALLTLSQAYP